MPSFNESEQYLPELAEFVAIPSVSRESNPPDMRAAAQWLADQVSFADGHLEETNGNPVVAGEWLGAPGAPTVLVYGHYDVQPTGALEEWRTPPFELTVADGKAFGRGATDDKGPILVVLKTAQAFMEQFGALPLNVKFLFEGEEEIGSPNLPHTSATTPGGSRPTWSSPRTARSGGPPSRRCPSRPRACSRSTSG